MNKEDKISYKISFLGLLGWIIINSTHLIFSKIFESPYKFLFLEGAIIPVLLWILSLLFIKFKILKIILKDKKKMYTATQLFFVFLNGVYATYLCLIQHHTHNSFSILFTYIFGLILLNRFLDFKGTLLFSLLFLSIFFSGVNLLNLPFGNDEKLLFYFFIYSSILFGISNGATISFMKRQKKYRKAIQDHADNLEKEVDKKTKSIKGLVENLGQGFMVMDKLGIIQEGATQITKEFFNIDPVGKTLPTVLKLDSEKKEIFNKWMLNIYRGLLNFRDLKSLGPQSYELNDRYIDLDYKPIYEEGSKKIIDKIICVATDKTQEISLERQVEIDKQDAKFIKTCLQNPVEFIDLLDDTFELFKRYPNIKSKDGGEIFRQFHTLKARFGQFGIKELSYYINEIEIGISKKDFFNLDSKVYKFDSELQEFIKKNRLIIEAANKFSTDQGKAVEVSDILDNKEKFSNLEDLFKHLRENYILSDIKMKFERYGSLVSELAENQSKAIDVEFTGDEIKVDANKYADFINSAIHLFRNMVDHGIETEDERIEKAKPQRGHIKVDFKNNGTTFKMNMIDDGCGIDPKKIKEKTVEKGLKSSEELEKVKDSELINMIFLPGFSTKEEVTELSGRGVGMDAVREEVKKLGGTISVSSKVDEGTEFIIVLPILN